ncbi:MAG: hypothetical protein JW703_03540 [Candidatus Diapherotrites archaeon]|nr:hypothetical protein [Candidatus Diapherotrites archaeon]
MNKGMFSAMLAVAAVIVLASTAFISQAKMQLTESEAFAQSINKVNSVWQNNYFEIKEVLERNSNFDLLTGNCIVNSNAINSFLIESNEITGIECSASEISVSGLTITFTLTCEKTFPGSIEKQNLIRIKKENVSHSISCS